MDMDKKTECIFSSYYTNLNKTGFQKSTKIYPIKFFEYILENKNNIQNLAENLLYHSEYSSYDFKEILLKNYLKWQCDISKDKMYLFRIKNSETNIKNYLSVQVKTIQKLISNNKDILICHTYFIVLFQSLIKYINEVLILPNMIPFNINKTINEFVKYTKKQTLK